MVQRSPGAVLSAVSRQNLGVVSRNLTQRAGCPSSGLPGIGSFLPARLPVRREYWRTHEAAADVDLLTTSDTLPEEVQQGQTA